MGKKLKKENLMALLALAAVIVIAILIINLDLLMPSEDYDIDGYTLTNFSYKSNPYAAVTIEEFSDFQCPYCARAGRTVEKIIEVYGNEVNIEFKHMPFHSDSQKAAEASECARDQEKFWEYHHMLFDNQNSLSVKSLKKYAEQLNLDTEQFNNCLDSGEKKSAVKEDYNEAIQRKVEGTPTFFINNKKLVGAQPFEAFKVLIDIELGREG